jgi:hypothetical protein
MKKSEPTAENVFHEISEGLQAKLTQFDTYSGNIRKERSSPSQAHTLFTLPAMLAISLLSWTFPRIGFLKPSELLALLASPRALISELATPPILKCYWPFVTATFYSFCIAMLMIGHGDNSLTSDKGLYASPALVPFATLARIGVYLLSVTAITYYFSVSGQEKISRTLRWTYYVTLFPGLLQIFRIYSGIYFSIPFFERSGYGPFSGVFNAGYLRLMGFEIEPLAYASSLITVCCLSMYNGRKIPWLGIILLIHTFGGGAIAGLFLAFLIATSRKLARFVVPLYAFGFALLCLGVRENMQILSALSLATGSVTERLFALNACISMWLDHPMGVGLGLYGYFYNLYDTIGRFPAASLDWYPNNDPAMFLVYGGPLFLGAYLYIFYFLLRRARSYWLFIAATALLFQSLSAYIFFNPATIVIFSLILANVAPIPSGERVGKWQLISPGPLRTFPFGIRFFVRKKETIQGTR